MADSGAKQVNYGASTDGTYKVAVQFLCLIGMYLCGVISGYIVGAGL